MPSYVIVNATDLSLKAPLAIDGSTATAFVMAYSLTANAPANPVIVHLSVRYASSPVGTVTGGYTLYAASTAAAVGQTAADADPVTWTVAVRDSVSIIGRLFKYGILRSKRLLRICAWMTRGSLCEYATDPFSTYRGCACCIIIWIGSRTRPR